MAKVEIFSGPGCSYCDQAKKLLIARGVRYEEVDISSNENRQELVRRLPRSRAIPQIFLDGEHIGSLEDLQILDRSGQLARILKADRKR